MSDGGYTDALLLEATGTWWWPSFGELSMYPHGTSSSSPSSFSWSSVCHPSSMWEEKKEGGGDDEESEGGGQTTTASHRREAPDIKPSSRKHSYLERAPLPPPSPRKDPSTTSTSSTTTTTTSTTRASLSPEEYVHSHFFHFMKEEHLHAAARRRVFFAAMTDAAVPMAVVRTGGRATTTAGKEGGEEKGREGVHPHKDACSSPRHWHSSCGWDEDEAGKMEEEEEEGGGGVTAAATSFPSSCGLSRLGRSTFHLTAAWYTPPSSPPCFVSPLRCSSSLSQENDPNAGEKEKTNDRDVDANDSSPLPLVAGNMATRSHVPPSLKPQHYVCVTNPFNGEHVFLRVLHCPGGMQALSSLSSSSCRTSASHNCPPLRLSLADLAQENRIRIVPASPPPPPPFSSGFVTPQDSQRTEREKQRPSSSSSSTTIPLPTLLSTSALEKEEESHSSRTKEEGDGGSGGERKEKDRKWGAPDFLPCACFSSFPPPAAAADWRDAYHQMATPCQLECMLALQPQALEKAVDTFSTWWKDICQVIEKAHLEGKRMMEKRIDGVMMLESDGAGGERGERRKHNTCFMEALPSLSSSASSAASSLLTITFFSSCGMGKEMCLSYLYQRLTHSPIRFPFLTSSSSSFSCSGTRSHHHHHKEEEAVVVGKVEEGEERRGGNSETKGDPLPPPLFSSSPSSTSSNTSTNHSHTTSMVMDTRTSAAAASPSSSTLLSSRSYISYYVGDYRSLHFASLLAMEADEVIRAVSQVCHPPSVLPFQLMEEDPEEKKQQGAEKKKVEVAEYPRENCASRSTMDIVTSTTTAAAPLSSSSSSPPSLPSPLPCHYHHPPSPAEIRIPILWINFYDVDLLLPSTMDNNAGGGGSGGGTFHSAVCWELLRQLDLLSQRRVLIQLPQGDQHQHQHQQQQEQQTKKKTKMAPSNASGSTLCLSSSPSSSFSIAMPIPVVLWCSSTQKTPGFLHTENASSSLGHHGEAGEGTPSKDKGTGDPHGSSVAPLHASSLVALLSRLCNRGAASSIFLSSPLSSARVQYVNQMLHHIQSHYYYYYGEARKAVEEKKRYKLVRSHSSSRMGKRKAEQEEECPSPPPSSPSPVFLPSPTSSLEETLPYLDALPVNAFCHFVHQWGKAYWESHARIVPRVKYLPTEGITTAEKKEDADDKNGTNHHSSSSLAESTCVGRIPQRFPTHPAPFPSSPFSSFFGLDDVISSLRRRLLWPLQHLPLLQHFAVPCVKGAILCGPSGSGKTALLAALAREIQQFPLPPTQNHSSPPPFAYTPLDKNKRRGREWGEEEGEASFARAYTTTSPLHIMVKDALTMVEKEVGRSEQNIAALFQEARAMAPTVLFLDNLDAIAAPRGRGGTGTSGASLLPSHPSTSPFTNGQHTPGEPHGTASRFAAFTTAPPPPGADSSHTATDRMLSTLLVEMDGLHAHTTSTRNHNNINHASASAGTEAVAGHDVKKGKGHSFSSSSLPPLVVVVSSAPSLHHLDPAVYRPGRLDVHIWLTPPSREACAKALWDRVYPVLFTDEASPLQKIIQKMLKEEEGEGTGKEQTTFTCSDGGEGDYSNNTKKDDHEDHHHQQQEHHHPVLQEVQYHLRRLIESRYGPLPPFPSFGLHPNVSNNNNNNNISSSRNNNNSSSATLEGKVPTSIASDLHTILSTSTTSTTTTGGSALSSSPFFSTRATTTAAAATPCTCFPSKQEGSSTPTRVGAGREGRRRRTCRNISMRNALSAPDVLADVRDVVFSLVQSWEALEHEGKDPHPQPAQECSSSPLSPSPSHLPKNDSKGIQNTAAHALENSKIVGVKEENNARNNKKTETVTEDEEEILEFCLNALDAAFASLC